jgi:hypothetical protein
MSTPVPDIAYDYEHFTLDQLERIVPIAQTRQIGEVEFTLLALECYNAGFLATTLIQQDWRVPEPPSRAAAHELPQLLQGVLLIGDAVDDLGNHYLSRVRAGAGGGGGKDGVYSRVAYCCAPALHPTARTLTLTLVQVERPRYNVAGRPVWQDNQLLGGPWVVSFALRAQPEQRATPLSVLPVAARIAVDDVVVSVTTLERDASGFVINSRVDWRNSDAPFPQPIWHASDDRGGNYGTGNCAGGGNAVGKTNTWRMHCRFQPALDPAAAELRLRLESLGLRRAVRSDEQHRFARWETAREVTDLGEIVVTLPPQGHALT